MSNSLLSVLFHHPHDSPQHLPWTLPVCTLSCVWLWDPMDYSLPESSVHGIFQARILEWVAISSFRGSSQPKDQTRVSCIGRWVLYHWATWEVPIQELPNSFHSSSHDYFFPDDQCWNWSPPINLGCDLQCVPMNPLWTAKITFFISHWLDTLTYRVMI